MRKELIEMITNNQFNAYCIDCQKNKSSHANITFGTFICDSCAKRHLELFGMHKHYIKPAFTEFWDPHQLQMAKAGGNQKFYSHLKSIGQEKAELNVKYNHTAVKGYKK